MLFKTKFKTKEVQQVFDYLSGMEGIVNGEKPLLKFIEQPSNPNMKGEINYWLSVEYLSVETHSLTEEPDKFRYMLLAAQSVNDYKDDTNGLLLRIILRLADKLRSTQQDINLLMRDYKLIRK